MLYIYMYIYIYIAHLRMLDRLQTSLIFGPPLVTGSASLLEPGRHMSVQRPPSKASKDYI